MSNDRYIVAEKGFERYISAIHQGHCGNYEVMRDIFKELLSVS